MMRRNIIAPATINYPLMDVASEKNRKKNVKTLTTVSETIDKIYLVEQMKQIVAEANFEQNLRGNCDFHHYKKDCSSKKENNI